MLVRAEPHQSTAELINVPLALASGVIASGLTAPAMRAFVVLVSHADGSGRIDIMKPRLAELASIRLDNADKFLRPLRESMLDIYAEIAGEGFWFDELEYAPGRRGKTAGVIRGQLSSAALAVLGHPTMKGEFPAPVAELRRLGTIAGILIYLRARAAIEKSPNAQEFNLRFDEQGLASLLGEYRRAAVSKTRLASGEVSMTVSISRIAATLLKPGIGDVAAAADGFALGMTEGRLAKSNRWRHVDVIVQRLRPRKSGLQMIKEIKAREEYLHDRRAERRSIKGQQSVQHGGNISVLDQGQHGD